MAYTTIDIQMRLKTLGYYDGKVDGISGPKTISAIRKFKVASNLPDTDITGPLFIAALFDNREIIPETPNETNNPSWLRVARTYLGVEEIVGYKHNPIITGWWERLGLSFKSDEIPWCAGFVGGCLEEVGIRSSRSGMARSYQNWGVKIPGPAIGAVVTSWRGSRSSSDGHVQFVIGRQGTKLLGIGGNQSNKVSIRPVDMARIISYNYPAAYPRPATFNINDLPLVSPTGKITDSEQ